MAVRSVSKVILEFKNDSFKTVSGAETRGLESISNLIVLFGQEKRDCTLEIISLAEDEYPKDGVKITKRQGQFFLEKL